jgi:hypothetical protein
MGLLIWDCGMRISDLNLASRPIRDPKSTLRNGLTQSLPLPVLTPVAIASLRN